MTMIRVLFVLSTAVLLPAGCVQTSTPSDGSSALTQQSDWAAVLKLEEQAKGIAKTTGCSTSGECRSAPVGSRGCGGPRYYVPWCAKSTDSAALYTKLNEVVKTEETYNKKYNVVSTCEYRLPPHVEVVGGACTAQ